MRIAPGFSAVVLSAVTALAVPFASSAQQDPAAEATPPQPLAPAAAPAPAPTPAPAPAPMTSPATDDERYAAREATSKSVAGFQGGDSTLIIGGSAVGLLLVVLIIVLVF